MLTNLQISNIVLIEKLNLEFSNGLNILTGETGAGKSILLDALSLALGARSDIGLIRHGCDTASVIAEFDTHNHTISNLLSVINRSLQWRNEPSTFSRRKLEDICYKLSSWLLSNMNKYREAYIIREKVHKLVVLLEDPSKYNPFVWGSI